MSRPSGRHAVDDASAAPVMLNALPARFAFGRASIVAAMCGWFAVILAATLVPASPAHAVLSPFCLWCGDYATVDVLANVALFLPLGVCFALLGLRARRVTIGAAVLSITIELLQHFVIPNRHGGVADVITNTTGAALGMLLVRHWRALVFPGTRGSVSLTLFSSALALIVLAGGSVLALPSFTGGRWWTLVAPDLAGFAHFTGRVYGAQVDDQPVGTAPIARGVALSRRWLTEPIRLSADVVPMAYGDGVAPIVAVFANGDEQALLGQRGNALVFGLRQRADDARLRSTLYVAAGPAFLGAAGTHRMRVAAEAARGRVTFSWRDDAGVRTAVIDMTPARSWAWFVPASTALTGSEGLPEAAWVIVLLAPLAYWSWRARRRAWRAAAPVTGALGLYVTPLILRVPPAAFTTVAGAALGIIGGWSLARAIGEREVAGAQRAAR